MTDQEAFDKAKRLFNEAHPKLRFEDQNWACVAMWEIVARTGKLPVT